MCFRLFLEKLKGFSLWENWKGIFTITLHLGDHKWSSEFNSIPMANSSEFSNLWVNILGRPQKKAWLGRHCLACHCAACPGLSNRPEVPLSSSMFLVWNWMSTSLSKAQVQELSAGGDSDVKTWRDYFFKCGGDTDALVLQISLPKQISTSFSAALHSPSLPTPTPDQDTPFPPRPSLSPIQCVCLFCCSFMCPLLFSVR